jgi:hypothetical protein
MEDKKWASPLRSRIFFANKTEEDIEVDTTERKEKKKVNKTFPLLYLPLLPTYRKYRGVQERNIWKEFIVAGFYRDAESLGAAVVYVV